MTIILSLGLTIAWFIFRKNLLSFISSAFGFSVWKNQPAVSYGSFSYLKSETLKYTSDTESNTSSEQSQSPEPSNPKSETEEEEEREYYRIYHQDHYKRRQHLDDQQLPIFWNVVLYILLFGVLAAWIFVAVGTGFSIDLLVASLFFGGITIFLLSFGVKPNPFIVQALIAKAKVTPVKGVVINYKILPAKKKTPNKKVYKYYIGINGEQKQRLYYSTDPDLFGELRLFKRLIFFPNHCALVLPKKDEKKK
jgi:hypothetical protein